MTLCQDPSAFFSADVRIFPFSGGECEGCEGCEGTLYNFLARVRKIKNTASLKGGGVFSIFFAFL